VEGRPLDDVDDRREAELVARARRGDADAYRSLMGEHETIAFRTAYLITRSAEDAEEATQDAFLKAYRSLGRFRPGAPFRPWLLAIVGNEARNRRRSGGRRAALALRARDELSSGDAAPSPEAAVIAADERRTLLDAIEALPADDRVVLACRYLVGLTEEETAAVIGRRRGTVKSRTSRALDRLRQHLEAADA
jgi:RNA polymerase sigma-70 factor (ECF subfamily)